MQYILETFNSDWELFLRFAPRLLYAALLLIFMLALGRLLGRTVAKLLTDRSRLTNEHLIRYIISWTLGTIGILLALGILGLDGVAASMLATGGVVAIVAGFAFREIGENLLAGIFLSFSRPFELGDLIKSGDLTGTVTTIQLRYVHLRTADACDVYVPSAQIFREPLYNYTRDGLRLPSFTIGVAYKHEPDQVVALLETAARKVKGLLLEPATYVIVKEFGSQYIEYEVFFWINVFTNKAGLITTSNAVKIACWQALNEAGLTFSSDVSSGIDILSTPELNLSVNKVEKHDRRT